ncbi:hypothetical protein PEDI_52880 [Persicobacter diffluens]|uniref:Uncharacterized protein n=1 Tax=Persicobacter diffluens TaxID=981 RepID=A0AAN5APX0_9BACT|nr:hypothetical protein PEDI_52880 [Persicobacter diffluens]
MGFSVKFLTFIPLPFLILNKGTFELRWFIHS